MRTRLSRVVLSLLLLLGASIPGCTVITGKDSDTVRLKLKRNERVARRLTVQAAELIEQEQYAEAQTILKRALEADPTWTAAHNNLGLVHFAQHDLFEAALAFQEALKCKPDNPAPQNNLGLTFETAGRMYSAIEHYQAAHELDPVNPEYLGNLIRARMRSGEPHDTMRHELQELLYIERRPDWIEWIEDQLELVTNPHLDRGPAAPELPQLGGGEVGEEADEASRVIYDSGLLPPASDELPEVPQLPQQGEPIPMMPPASEDGPTMESDPGAPGQGVPPATPAVAVPIPMGTPVSTIDVRSPDAGAVDDFQPPGTARRTMPSAQSVPPLPVIRPAVTARTRGWTAPVKR